METRVLLEIIRPTEICSAHRKGFSPVWVRMCDVRVPEWLNAAPHPAHENGFSPVWDRMCDLRFPEWLNAAPHSAHENSFSPVWVRMCVLRHHD